MTISKKATKGYITMTSMKIKFKKLTSEAQAPKQGKSGNAGFDLTAVRVERLDSIRVKVYSGIAVEIPEGYEGQVRACSSIHKYDAILSNGVGTIDSGYRGEICAVFYHCGPELPYEAGDRFAQLVIKPVPRVEYVEADELSESERGAGGYGSTGKN